MFVYQVYESLIDLRLYKAVVLKLFSALLVRDSISPGTIEKVQVTFYLRIRSSQPIRFSLPSEEGKIKKYLVGRQFFSCFHPIPLAALPPRFDPPQPKTPATQAICRHVQGHRRKGLCVSEKNSLRIQ